MLLASKGMADYLKPPTEETEDEAYLKYSPVALAHVTLALADTQLQKVLHCETAYEVMEILNLEYASQSITRRLLLKRQLFSLHMEENDNIRTHIAKIDNLITELCNINIIIDTEDAAISLLISLPPSWPLLWRSVLEVLTRVQESESSSSD
eukprot:Phypoly_transcript_05071.p1 GENE.Phypoly_transcript_05071~~Phypoly_transcript_05071.p1  ORF type:complete len:152 (-),score=20.18 Phypoly_transcript_05071:330-785(-)